MGSSYSSSIINDKRCYKKERALLFGDEVAVLAYPAQAAAVRPAAFKYRGRINKAAALHFANMLVDKRQQGMQFFLITSW